MTHRARIVSVVGRAYVRCTSTNHTETGGSVVEALSKLRRHCKCIHRKEYNLVEEQARLEATQFMRVHEDRVEATSVQNAKVEHRLTSNWRVGA